MRIRNLILLGTILFGISACAPEQPTNTAILNSDTCGTNGQPTYTNNGSYDDNGAEPAPNNCNQNFGRRW